jgi:NDP-sugar pyrophosphorylase family protein
MMGPLRGGIIAAGDGSRLRAAGYALPKPLVPVAGKPLLRHVVENFHAAGIRSLTVIVNEDGRACLDVLDGWAAEIEVRWIVKTTASSLESFFEVVSDPAPGRMLVSTVDALCRAEDFTSFASAASSRPADATVLGVTPLVADEKPLWVSLGKDARIERLGGERGELVTAGFYLVPERVRRMARPAHLDRLRDFLAWLVGAGEPVYGEVVERVVDVDRREDIELAETLARSARASREVTA